MEWAVRKSPFDQRTEQLPRHSFTHPLLVWLDGVIPTAENLARVFFHRVAPELPAGVDLVAITVHETERNSATYTPD